MANKWTWKKKELDEQYKRGLGAAKRANEPRARTAFYNKKTGEVEVHLVNGSRFAFSPKNVQGLHHATPEQLAKVSISPAGLGLHWESLDADYTIAGLLMGLFGTKTWMQELGRRGGAQTSSAKRNASRQNGKLGGRPKKWAMAA